MSIMHTKGDD